ncbi:helix-turn-helix domain-containing protein [Gallaecimonas mangrovi]|uniref:helix-turn-helix domain-containing protein n=1 Tax=Gallaecimonas mangrovi TaxID=2291597 RepID=UPI000E20B474|nr:XRE family transcriptional regulator [Gallaecimonas mangrovi]
MDIEQRLAEHLRQLRLQSAWSLDELAKESGVSRATLSRLEKGSVSPTTAVLAKLCSCYGLTLSQLLQQAEAQSPALVRASEQPCWVDSKIGFTRLAVSPPDAHLKAEVARCTLAAGSTLHYPKPSRPGLEHHLFMLQGQLRLTVASESFELNAGDCLRYKTFGSTDFVVTGNMDVVYLLVLV